MFAGGTAACREGIGGEYMILYHGSNVVVSKPRLIDQNRFLDFGFGFYTTTNRVQAIAFADKVYRRRREGGGKLSASMSWTNRLPLRNVLPCALMPQMRHGLISFRKTAQATMTVRTMI